MKAKLTKKLIDTLQPGETVYSVRDTEVKGFLLRVSPSGGMVYYLDYKTHGGQRKSYRIGGAGNLTPAQARDAAERLSADVALGKDVQLEKQQRRAETAKAKFTTLAGPPFWRLTFDTVASSKYGLSGLVVALTE